MDRLTPFSVLHHHNKKRSYYCGLVTCLNIPPSLSCPFRVFHPPNKCGVIHDPPHPVPRWWIPFDIVDCSALNCVKQPSHPCTTSSTTAAARKQFCDAQPSNPCPTPTTNHRPWCSCHSPLHVVCFVTLLDCLYFVPPHMVDGPKQ